LNSSLPDAIVSPPRSAVLGLRGMMTCLLFLLRVCIFIFGRGLIPRVTRDSVLLPLALPSTLPLRIFLFYQREIRSLFSGALGRIFLALALPTPLSLIPMAFRFFLRFQLVFPSSSDPP